MSEPIAAIATGLVPAGIGILRLSGDGALSLAQRVFRPFRGAPMDQRRDRELVYGALVDAGGETLDLCLCTVSRGPHSYTGEDCAEFQCHGSPMVLRLGLDALCAAGARLARAGEFTRRAFLNGRMDLVQAEAVIDLIHAESALAARNAAGQLGGAILRRTDAVYERLREISSHYHAVVDFPDEDVEDFTLQAYADALRRAEAELARLEASFQRSRMLTGGVPTAIVGRPNAGKSSLLNALLGYERAIVTEVPGTTRDTIAERCELGGVLLRLIDTAGLRETADAVERIGVERSRAAMAEAELVLLLCDGSAPFTEADAALLREAEGAAPTLLLRSKCDLPQTPWPEAAAERALPLSALTGDGLEELSRAVARLLPPPETRAAGEILTSARQAEAVGRARESVAAAREAMEAGFPPDAVLTETEAAMEALGELSGRSVRSDVTEQIFSRFCVGK